MEKNTVLEQLSSLTQEELNEIFSKMSLKDINDMVEKLENLKKGLVENG